MRGRIQILLAALLWSSAGAAIKLSKLDAWQVSGGRSLVAAITLFLLLPRARRWPSLKAWGVAVAYAATVTLFVIANKLTTAANAIFLQDTAPLWVVLLSVVWLKERPTRVDKLLAPLFGVGMVMFFFDQLAPGQLAGNAIALVSGVAFGTLIVGLRARQDEYEPVLVAGNALAAVAVAPLALLGPAPTALDLGLVLYLGVFQLGLAYVLFSRGLKETRAIEASLLMLIEPVLNPIWTFLLARERPGPWAIGGGAVIVAAIAGRAVAGRKIPAVEPPAGA